MIFSHLTAAAGTLKLHPRVSLVRTLIWVMLARITTSAYGVPVVPAHAPAGWNVANETVLPSVALRGYGTLSGRFAAYRTESGAASVLLIQAEDAAKAGLVLGKFRSDLRCLGGVAEDAITVDGKRLPTLRVDGQGSMLAARDGASVVVVTGRRASDMAKLLAAIKFSAATNDYTGTAVPAFLDKFDRWGFGFWSPDPLRPPEKQDATYDVRERFEWAKKMGVALQIDVQLNQSGSAAGILDDNGKRWGIDLARQMGIPVMVQMQGAPAPGWIANRYADEMQLKAPQFIGNFYGINGFNGWSGSPLNQIGWASVAGKDRLFADQYAAVDRYKGYSNVTGYGEWHGEVAEGPLSLFMDYGPVVDARYRDYLRQKYGTPQAIDKRWYGGRGQVKAWADVRTPEPANFLGWNEDAMDLQGEWRTRYESDLQAGEKDRWGDPALADMEWRKVIAPGDDRQIFKEKWRVPTIFRRHFNLSEAELARLKAKGKVYLYALTLQQNANYNAVKATINGKALPDQPQRSHFSWSVFDVTSELRTGENVVALSLPCGELSYRVYLSPWEPRCYPDLGPEMNARWVDYRDFITWMREDGLRRSIEAIRRRDSDKFIKLYAPHSVIDVMKALSEDYGCYCHDTGFMSGIWDDSLPGLMRSSGMPMSLEPGGPAPDLRTLKRFLGIWSTEGLQNVDYFMDIGDVMWRPDQKAWFEAHQPLVHLMGKCHYPNSEVAVLQGAHSQRLTGFPWDQFDTPLLWGWRKRGVGTYINVPAPRDLINEIDFERGNVRKYKVIVDDSTFVMDDALIGRIEEWVRAGGTFITQGQTGRHSSEVANAWPINRLTGYEVIGGNDNSRVGAVPGQPIFTDPQWTKTDARGLPALGGAGMYLRKVAPECQDILAWPNGAGIAMGVRPLGRGKIITMATPMPGVASGWPELLTWCGAKPPLAPQAPGCRVSRFVSNNGLFDVYVMWAENLKESGQVTLTVPGRQTTMLDLVKGVPVQGRPGANGASVDFAGLSVEPLETYVFLMPRQDLDQAPLSWLQLQREWWKGTRQPGPAPVLKPYTNNTLDLDQNWAFKPVDPAAKDVTALVAADTDDAGWDRMDLGIWYGAKYPDVRRGIFRRKFRVPQEWVGTGQTWIWLRRTNARAFLPPYKTRVFLDGKEIYFSAGWGYASLVQNVTARLTPGLHVLAVDTESTLPVGGIPSNLWLEHLPDPPARQSLAGDWNGNQLPGVTAAPFPEIKREFKLDPVAQGKRTLLYVETAKGNVTGIILNGRIINRDLGGQHFLMDITPFLREGQPNTLTLVSQYGNQPLDLTSVELRFFEPGSY